ncbi:MAG: hypothetical protein IKA82_02285 [Clostridia bacterium]|nr:hypothetical protein [Clostridia bacterium]
MNFPWTKKKTTNYGKIIAITVAAVAGACAVAYFLVKLYEKHIACKLALEDYDDDCICELDLDDDCDCECELCNPEDVEVEVVEDVVEE